MRLYQDKETKAIYTDGRAFDRVLKATVMNELRYGNKYDLDMVLGDNYTIDEIKEAVIIDTLDGFTIYHLNSDGHFSQDDCIEWDYDHIITEKEVRELLEEKDEEMQEFNEWMNEIEQWNEFDKWMSEIEQKF